MVTNIKLDIGDEELASLGLALTGKKHNATRKEVTDWVMKIVGERLVKGPTVKYDAERHALKNQACIHCGKPTAVVVPRMPTQPSLPASEPKHGAKYDQAAAGAMVATQALVEALTELRESLKG